MEDSMNASPHSAANWPAPDRATLWCSKEDCERIVAAQVARGLSFTTEIVPADMPEAPEWAYVIRYR